MHNASKKNLYTIIIKRNCKSNQGNSINLFSKVLSNSLRFVGSVKKKKKKALFF